MIILKPRLNKGLYVFHSSKLERLANINSLLTFKEPEGITHIIDIESALKLGLNDSETWSWITLDYQSELTATGITAAFSNELAHHQIPCNVVAGYYHDHIFVPSAKAGEAIRLIEKIKLPDTT